MTTPPFSPPFHAVLQALQLDLNLSEEQLAALPPLEEVELTPQSDSHKIQHADMKPYTYHPYKLFIGEHNNDPFHAYLMRTGGRQQYRIELCSVNKDEDTDCPPMDAQWYGTVSNLAYPFNTFLGAARFSAVVKWYFLLAFRAGEFDEDPGFSVTKSWRTELQGACNELIVAPQKEQQKKIKDLEKKAEMLRRAMAKKNRKSEGTIEQQTAKFQENITLSSQSKAKSKVNPGRRRTRESSGRTSELEDVNSPGDQRRQEPSERHASLQPPQHLEPKKPRIVRPGLGWMPPLNPYPRGLGSRRYLPDLREATPLLHPEAAFNLQFGLSDESRKEPTWTHREGVKKKSGSMEDGIVPTDEWPTQRREGVHATNDEKLDRMNKRLAEHEGFVPSQENSMEWKRRFTSKSTERSSGRPPRGRRGEHAAEEDEPDAADGSIDGNRENRDATRMSWTQEVGQVIATRDDEREEDEMEEEEVEADDSTQAERERRWMHLFRERAELLQQMHRLEDEMSVEQRLDLFDKVKYV